MVMNKVVRYSKGLLPEERLFHRPLTLPEFHPGVAEIFVFEEGFGV